MKLLFIIAILLACIISGAANAWEIPKVGIEGAIEETHQYEWIKEHNLSGVRHQSDIHQFIHQDMDSVLAQIEQDDYQARVNKINEKYIGR